MLSPTPFPLFCALLLSLPIAVVFTVRREPASAPPDPGLHRFFLFSLNPQHVPAKIPTTLPLPEDDDSLLQLASRVDPNPSLGSTRKVAFMFLTTTPLPFAPLWETFFNGSSPDLYNVYIHADPTQVYDPPFAGRFANRVIHSKPSLRFTPTLASAARRLLAHALVHDPQNYMFALLSPSCVPIHSFGFTYRTLISSPKSFIEILRHEPGQFDRWAARGPLAMLPEVKLEDFRIGSQFWVLSRRHACAVARDRRIWNKFDVPCLREDTCYPEENYFSTLLSMLDPRGVVPATLTHVDWSVNEGGHPRMYEPEEVVPGLIRRLRMTRPRYGGDGNNGSDWSATERKDPFLFARKFSPAALEPLMAMARSVLFNDSAEGA